MPKCASCLRRKAECVYVVRLKGMPRSSRETSPPVVEDGSSSRPAPQSFDGAQEQRIPAYLSHYGDKHLLDLRLMHRYTAYTVEAFVGAGVSMEVGDLISILKTACRRLPFTTSFSWMPFYM